MNISTSARLLACLVFAMAMLVVAPLFGRVEVELLAGWREWWAGADTPATRVLALRLPRILLGFVAGASLAVTGATMQTLLRNPLATPYTLGVSFAGATGAFVALSIPGLSETIGGAPATALFAFAFTLAEIVLLARLLRSRAGRSTNELLLAGVTLNFIFSAVILFLRYLADPLRLRAMDRWMMGGLQVGGFGDLSMIPVLLLPSMVILFLSARSLDQLAMGEELAASRGVPVVRTQRVVLVAGSIATAAIVAVTGPIGFVGLLVPHAARALVGASHGSLLTASALLGGGFLVLADGVVRELTLGGRGSELPVGVLTALVGGPLFLTLLLRGWRARPGS